MGFPYFSPLCIIACTVAVQYPKRHGIVYIALEFQSDQCHLQSYAEFSKEVEGYNPSMNDCIICISSQAKRILLGNVLRPDSLLTPEQLHIQQICQTVRVFKV